jgi:glutamate-1-semialdehyde 2,1-aminomutase
LEVLEKTEALKTIENRGKRLMDGIHTLLMEAEIEHAVTGVPAMFSFVLGVEEPPKDYRAVNEMDADLYEQIQKGMRARGIEYELDAKEPWFLCEAHSEADIDETLFALRDTLKDINK